MGRREGEGRGGEEGSKTRQGEGEEREGEREEGERAKERGRRENGSERSEVRGIERKTGCKGEPGNSDWTGVGIVRKGR